VVLTRVLSLEQAQRELTKGLWLLLSLGGNSEQDLDAIARVLRRAPGSCPVYLTVKDGTGRRASLKLGEEFRINPSTFPMGEMETILGRDRVKFAGAVNGAGRNGK
jgi:DNA polymerase-3 subunit alpha